ncbi:MAG: MarC family protein [Thermoprotei archaeon]|jgi:multiple antibiotic resistance protein
MLIIEDILLIAAMTIQIYSVLNPISVVPFYITVTSNMNPDERKSLIKRSFLIVLGLLALFSLVGGPFFTLLNISISGLKFGGGVILMILAIDTLGGFSRTKSMSEEDIAVVPLATPLLVGPGTITTLLILSSFHPIYLVFTSAIIAGLLSYVTLNVSHVLVRVLRKSGTVALARLMSIILAAFAADMIHSALVDWGIAK